MICLGQIPRKGTSEYRAVPVRFGFLLFSWPGVWLPQFMVLLAADF